MTKPVSTELLQANLQKVADAMYCEAQPNLVLRQKGATVSIPCREIYFIEIYGNTLRINTANGTITARERLKNVMHMLPPVGFLQCHKSFIVNMNHVFRIQAKNILLKTGETVPVSRAKYVETRDAYFAYMGQRF